MPTQFEKQQYAELQHHAHSIKSSSLNMGTEVLAEMAEQLETLSEQASKEPDPGQAQLEPLVEMIQQAYTALKPQLA